MRITLGCRGDSVTIGDFDDEFAELASIAHELTEFDPFVDDDKCVFCGIKNPHKNHVPHCLFKRAEAWRWRHASSPGRKP